MSILNLIFLYFYIYCYIYRFDELIMLYEVEDIGEVARFDLLIDLIINAAYIFNSKLHPLCHTLFVNGKKESQKPITVYTNR